MKRDARLAAAEAILGHEFADRQLLEQALTHPSAVESEPERSYERLEFLGDAVVGLCIAECAYKRWPDVQEGDLTKMRVAVVKGSFLSKKQAELGLGELIIFGASEHGQAARGLSSALEDTFESLVGALYLDAGYQVAYDWVTACLGASVTPELALKSTNPKSELQEIVQRDGRVAEYRIIEASGPAHMPRFVAEVLVEGRSLAHAEGSSKKEAEAAAAAVALEFLK